MLTLLSIGSRIAARRRSRRFTQEELARKAGISRATLDALENGRTGELGFRKVSKLLAVLGLELSLQPAASRRPTLEELIEEDRHDQSMDRRR